MHTLDWCQPATAGLGTAVAAGDLFGQAACHLSLVDVHGRQGEHDRAIEHYRRALALNQESGWVDGESAAAGSLGNLYWWTGHLSEAVEQYTHALARAERTDRTAGQAVSLGNLGAVHWNLGETERSATCHRCALDLDRQLGFRLDETFEHLCRSLALHCELGDKDALVEDLRRDGTRARETDPLADPPGPTP